MKNINIHIHIKDSEYNISIGKDILKNLALYIKKLGINNTAIITDKNVGKLYLNTLIKSIEKENIKVSVIVLPPGEKTKSMKTIEYIFSLLAKYNIKRNDLLISLGGGVIGDITGFVSSIWLRGLDYIQIPTTLLSQIDSSIGGKTAVNTRYGKNLIGSFHNPKRVFIDTNTLYTLNRREFFSGVYEMIKHAAIADKEMFAFFEENYTYEKIIENINSLIEKNINIKKTIVEKDPYEKNERMKLNFGHTFAHAIENIEGYKNYLHGEAVAIGMILSCKLGQKMSLTDKDASLRIENLINKTGLAYNLKIKKNILDKIILDKKSNGENINFIFIKTIGKVFIEKIPINSVYALYK